MIYQVLTSGFVIAEGVGFQVTPTRYICVDIVTAEIDWHPVPADRAPAGKGTNCELERLVADGVDADSFLRPQLRK